MGTFIGNIFLKKSMFLPPQKVDRNREHHWTVVHFFKIVLIFFFNEKLLI